MKNKFIIASCAIALSLTAGTAFAESDNVNIRTNTDIHGEASVSASSSFRNDGDRRGDDDRSTSTRREATSSEDRDEHGSSTSWGKFSSKDHGSAVSAFVHSLFNIAGREGGIGSRVRLVAQSQNDSGTTTIKAMGKVENRSAIRTFLFGNDLNSLAVIKSEIATTTANIAQLQVLLSQATSDTDRAELTLQIKNLQDEQAALNLYVTAHEGGFSLFGWLKKLLVK